MVFIYIFLVNYSMKHWPTGAATSWHVPLPAPLRPSRAGRPPPSPRSDLWLSSKLKDPRDNIGPLRVTKGDRPDAGSLNLNPSGHVATMLTGSGGQVWASTAAGAERTRGRQRVLLCRR